MVRIISKLLIFFLSLTHTNTQIPLSAHGYFFHGLIPTSEFSSQLNPHSEDLFLNHRNSRFHNQFYIWIVTFLKGSTR